MDMVFAFPKLKIGQTFKFVLVWVRSEMRHTKSFKWIGPRTGVEVEGFLTIKATT